MKELKKKIREGSEAQLNEAISKGGLKLTDSQIATVSFAFWLVYMAETDLNYALRKGWTLAGSFSSSEVNNLVEKQILDLIGGQRKVDLKDPEYFSDKIKIYEAFFGQTKRTKMLWKLNDIRNNISHNRIDELNYDGVDLAKRETKEKVLIDYFETALNSDFSASPIWTSLTESQKKEAEVIFDDAKRKGII